MDKRMSVKKEEIMKLHQKAKDLEDDANVYLKGRKVRIISTYNGQPHGTSKKPLTGQVFTIKRIYFDHREPGLFLEGQDLSLGLSEVEFID
jgi:hypothetical protein